MFKTTNRFALIAALSIGAGMFRNAEPGSDGAGAAPVEPKVKLSRRESLVQKYTAGVERYNALAVTLQEQLAEINSIDALASIGVGSDVVVNIGKGDTAKTVAGVVIGVKEDEEGAKLYKVQYGTGFDADITVVKSGRLALPISGTDTADSADEASAE